MFHILSLPTIHIPLYLATCAVFTFLDQMTYYQYICARVHDNIMCILGTT